MAFKPGLANVLNLKPTSSLRYAKYFPNNSEYASKVYPEKKRKLKHRNAETQTEEDTSIPTGKQNKIVDENHIEEKRDQSQPIASQTEGVDVLQSYTQTEDTHDAVEIAIQTEEVDVQDNSKRVYETPEHTTVGRENENKQTSGKHVDKKQYKKKSNQLPISLNSIKGEPRIVVSVIGKYNTCVHGYSEKGKEKLMKSFRNIGIEAERCGFLYHQRKHQWMGNIDNTTRFELKDFPETVIQYYGNVTEKKVKVKKGKTVQEEEKVQEEENVQQEEKVQEKNVRANNMKIIDLESDINNLLYTKFGKTPNKKRVNVPVVLVSVNGDLEILSHVARAVQCNISVVIIKGLGGVSDLLVLCMEDIRNLRKFSPTMLNRKISDEMFSKMETAVNIIINRYWLITIFDLMCDTPETLWEQITDGIIRAWSFDKEKKYTLYVPSFNQFEADVKSISKFAVDIDWLSKKELFDVYASHGSVDKNKSFLANAIFEQTTDEIRKFKDDTSIKYDDKFMKQLYKKAITDIDKNKEKEGHTIVDILKSACPAAVQYIEQDTQTDNSLGIKSIQDAEFQIGNHLLKRFCFSRVGMGTCCHKIRTDSVEIDETKGDRPFRLCIFSNKETGASEYWGKCENPMLSALFASCCLKAMANIAENWFEDSLQRLLEEHANLFAKRAEKLLDKMFEYNEEMTTDALDHASEVWSYVESPLHFGHQFCMEEFISHRSTQKDADTRFYSYRNGKASKHNENGKKDSDWNTKDSDEITKDSDRNTKDSDEIRKDSDGNTKDSNEITKDSDGNTKDSDEITKDSDGNTKDSDENKTDSSENKKDNDENTNDTGTNTKDIDENKNSLNPDQVANHHHREKQWYKYLTAPVSRMMINVTLFIAVLIMFSIFLMTDLKYNSISVLEWIVFVWIFGDLIEEFFNTIRPEDGNWSPQRILLHVFDIWNFIAILADVMFINGFITRVLGPEEILIHTRRIYSLSLFLMYLRLFNVFLMFKNIGVIIIMVKEMLIDLLYYLVILMILIVAAGTVYHANIYPNYDVKPFPDGIQNWRIWTILRIPYWQVYGELFLDTLEASDFSDCENNATIWSSDPTVERCPTKDWITTVIAAFYMMLSNWLLLNIVIAMFSARFDSITNKSKQKWRYHRHSVVISYEHRIPSPVNLIMRPLCYISCEAKCQCCHCSTRKPKGNMKKMLEKQRELAEEIIRNEKRDGDTSNSNH